MRHAITHLKEERRALLFQLQGLQKARAMDPSDHSQFEVDDLIEQTRSELADVTKAIGILESLTPRAAVRVDADAG